ncbi:ABC transporter periplasmic-binding protein YtfQ precursor [Rubripirellula amarantea]|uniref:ABC transporter periplasmic-binding protein YtfQ n=1 Tax=Rubripirellula amarantea TaxID=2527999 RepID=A0A5C5WEP3_9BACT|nr:ABC transporter substrate-binding protein [Rubripirellula amarantea]TWT49396.1 ABC transporter periplasmic-binding protein YtfQ precursor [Rubripirellula amarantea]
MNRKLSKLHFTLIVMLLGIVVGCSSSKGPQSDDVADADGSQSVPVIGFVQTGAESDWRKAHSESVRDAAKASGYDLRFADGQGKQENQIKALSSFVAQGVDGIILSPLVETGWDNVLEKAKKRDIPVLILDRQVDVKDDSLYVTYIGADTYNEGRLAAEWLIEETGGTAKVVELQGTPGASPTINRFKGFRDVIADHSGIEIIATQSGDFRRSKGKEVMEAMLKKHGDDIDVVYAHNDDMAIGAIQAIEDAGKKPGDDIILVSIDGVRGAFEAMVEGKLNCTVECNPLQGPMAFEAMDKILAGDTADIPKKQMIKDEVYDRDTAKDVIDSRKY